MDKKFIEKMKLRLDEISVELRDTQMEQFYQYYVMMIEKNKVMNLTAITDLDDVIEKHLVDSLALIKVIPDVDIENYSVIDVGTGAGFPGIPLKIAFPNLKITLMDSLNKRVNFLKEVIDILGLTDIDAVHSRAEDLGHDENYREKYDICVSRAVAQLSTLSEYCIPFVKKDGCFISYKSGKVEEELVSAEKSIKLLGGEIERVVSFYLMGQDGDMGRSFVKVKKMKSTSKRYPRKAGLPSKEPL